MLEPDGAVNVCLIELSPLVRAGAGDARGVSAGMRAAADH